MSQQERFFAAVAKRQLVRPAVRAIVQSERGFLVQKPTDDPTTNYAFIGGEYELGDTFEARLRKEFEEETNARVLRADYRFVVENRFLSGRTIVQTLEHYFEVQPDRLDIASREADLEQIWLPAETFVTADVRPTVVRDALLTSEWRAIRRLQVQL